MEKKQLILLFTLIGIIIPFGNVFGPAFVKCNQADDIRFRRNVVRIEAILSVVAYALGILVWLDIFKTNLVAGTPIDCSNFYVMLILPISVLLIAIGGLIYLKGHKQS